MTWTAVALAVIYVAVYVAGCLTGLRHQRLDNDSYWQGFADGELHALMNERAPSPN